MVADRQLLAGQRLDLIVECIEAITGRPDPVVSQQWTSEYSCSGTSRVTAIERE